MTVKVSVVWLIIRPLRIAQQRVNYTKLLLGGGRLCAGEGLRISIGIRTERMPEFDLISRGDLNAVLWAIHCWTIIIRFLLPSPSGWLHGV